MTAVELADAVRATWPETVISRGELSIVLEREELVPSLERLRDEPGFAFDLFLGVTATDWPDAEPRFWLAYELYSMTHRHRARLKVGLSVDDPTVPSVTHLYPAADWHERETYDFFGIVFEGHPNLRRILLPEGWETFPLRKTEELGGVNTYYRGGAFIPPVDKRTS